MKKETTLQSQLESLNRMLRAEKRKSWARDLPFDEMLFDRSERARSLGMGAGTTIYQNSYVFGDVKVGKKTWIGPFTILDGTGKLRIGDFCSISAGVLIYTHDSVGWALSGGKEKYGRAPVTIGNCCYIGSHSIVDKGVRIGDHSVVAAGSFVKEDVAPYTVVGGVPARVIGHVRLSSKGLARLDFKKGKK